MKNKRKRIDINPSDEREVKKINNGGEFYSYEDVQPVINILLNQQPLILLRPPDLDFNGLFWSRVIDYLEHSSTHFLLYATLTIPLMFDDILDKYNHSFITIQSSIRPNSYQIYNPTIFDRFIQSQHTKQNHIHINVVIIQIRNTTSY